MFGFEFHKPDVFERVVAFVEGCRIKHVSLTVLSPYAGTPMGERLKKEGRILSSDWAQYDQAHVVHRPAGMTPEELESGFGRVVDRIGDRCPIEKTMRTFAEPPASREGIPAYLERTLALVGPEPLARFGKACVAIAGLGGVGGAILPSLVRMGIGRFHLSDPGEFDMPDLNRQFAATRDTLGRNKAEVYEAFIRSVNPDAEVKVFEGGITGENAEAFVEGADLLIDALDRKVEPAVRLKLAAAARAQGIYNISSPILGFGTIVAVAAPGGPPMDLFMEHVAAAREGGGLPPGILRYLSPAYMGIMGARMGAGVVPSIVAAGTLSASIVAAEAAMILGGDAMPGRRAPVCLPLVHIADLAQTRYSVVDLAELAQSRTQDAT
jgi:hypothetical protein